MRSRTHEDDVNDLLAQTGGTEFEVNKGQDLLFRIIPKQYGDQVNNVEITGYEKLTQKDKEDPKFRVAIKFDVLRNKA